MLKNNLAREAELNYTPEEISEAFRRARLSLSCRGEELTIQDFILLADSLEEIRPAKLSLKCLK